MASKRKAAARVSRRPAFWLVWRDGHNSTPHFKHDTLKSAQAEAMRLAHTNPGERFFVLPVRDFALSIVTVPEWGVAKPVERPQVVSRTVNESPF